MIYALTLLKRNSYVLTSYGNTRCQNVDQTRDVVIVKRTIIQVKVVLLSLQGLHIRQISAIQLYSTPHTKYSSPPIKSSR